MADRLCVLPHRRVPAVGEPFRLPDGKTGIGDGVRAVHDLAIHGGRPVAGAHPHAQLCRGHAARLAELIADTPQMIAWLREQIEPTNSAPDRSNGYTRSTKNEAPLPLSVAAVDAADEELVYLCEWARMVAAYRGEAEPDLPAARRVDRTGERRVIGIRPGPAVWMTANMAARFLLDRFDWIIERDWVGEMTQELGAQRGTHLARWPTGDRARRLRGYRCARCSRESVLVHPPAGPPVYDDEYRLFAVSHRGQVESQTIRPLAYAYPMLVACSDPRCGERVPESEWAWAAQTAEHYGREIRGVTTRPRARRRSLGENEGNGWQ
ncbi:hypothetical protein [Rhodococcus sp. SGAir0479]|uniref:hypothetical protein n=1 Tax=Rhodococcus sp. SGAir0479 TaxID=2567884 RepID=UPI0010CD69C5|nr:hypothetical protein [Rhodococcus sp. SGAir0479]QCQ91745.1 hypothetical protein E7742_11225 [Rhodococcus sp. SGAir0479]